MNSHKCSVCLGGGYKLWSNGLPSLSSCPICHGSGRISDAMPVSDALADAETLEFCHNAYKGLSKCWEAPYPPKPGFACCDIAEAKAWGEILRWQLGLGHDEASGYAEEAARAAFRAVPGLRGE